MQPVLNDATETNMKVKQMDPNTLLLTVMLVILGALISGAAGFGFMLVTVPFLILLYPPKVGIALAISIGICGVLVQFLRVRQFVSLRLVAPLAAGAVVGVTVGAPIFAAIDPNMLKVLVGATVMVAALLQLISRQPLDLPARIPSLPAVAGAGLLGGILSITTGQAGPPVVYLLAWSRLDKAVVRATLVTFFLMVNAMSLVALARTGVLTVQIGLTGVAMLPAYLTGLLLGDQVFKRTGQGAYRKVILAVLLVAALAGLINGVNALD